MFGAFTILSYGTTDPQLPSVTPEHVNDDLHFIDKLRSYMIGEEEEIMDESYEEYVQAIEEYFATILDNEVNLTIEDLQTTFNEAIQRSMQENEATKKIETFSELFFSVWATDEDKEALVPKLFRNTLAAVGQTTLVGGEYQDTKTLALCMLGCLTLAMSFLQT